MKGSTLNAKRPPDIPAHHWDKMGDAERARAIFMGPEERRKAFPPPSGARSGPHLKAKERRRIRRAIGEGKAAQAKLKAIRDLPEDKKKEPKRKARKPTRQEFKPSNYSAFLRSDYWRDVRAKVIRRDGGRCCGCGRSDRVLDVHHLTYEHHGRELDFLGDLVTLCRTCHDKEHGKLAPDATL